MSRSRKSRERVEHELTQVFSCLADPTRRQILALLRDSGELRVGDLAAAFEMSLNGVSKHLKVLEGAGLISRRRDGSSHWISASAAALAPALEYLQDYQDYWNRRLDALGDYLKETADE